jgi:hypothetical protein
VRRAAIAFALIVAMAGTAWPCPAPPPGDDGGYRCAKYDRMYDRIDLPMPTPVQVYVRDEKGTLPKKTKKAMRYLTSSGWHARAGEPTTETLQLFDAANVPDTYEAVEGARQVFIRSLEKIDHQLQITLDDGTFKVIRCKEKKRTRTCLVRVQ